MARLQNKNKKGKKWVTDSNIKLDSIHYWYDNDTSRRSKFYYSATHILLYNYVFLLNDICRIVIFHIYVDFIISAYITKEKVKTLKLHLLENDIY